jgi:hypothetical protein
MTCAEFEGGLPEYLEGPGNSEMRSHAAGCEACSELALDLQAITTEAKTLQAADEPSPRVWNSIEIALRQEGLIRQPQAVQHKLHVPSFARRWGMAGWLVPALGAVVLAAFVLTNPHPVGEQTAKVSDQHQSVRAKMSPDDEAMLKEVADRSPMMTTAYETNLNSVNQYIRDAQAIVDENPNDEEAQRSLMEAYEQKSMLNEIALDRSLQ